MALEIFFIRHGETQWNFEHRIQGRSGNSPLTTRGKKQAKKTADFLAHYSFDAFYSSPLERALETATIINSPHKHELLTHPSLEEMDFGEWEGKTSKEIPIKIPYHVATEKDFHFSCPGGETYFEAYSRFSQAIAEIGTKHPNQIIGVVTHGLMLLLLISNILGGYKNSAITIDNCSIHRVRLNDSGKLKLITLNQIHHLDNLL